MLGPSRLCFRLPASWQKVCLGPADALHAHGIRFSTGFNTSPDGGVPWMHACSAQGNSHHRSQRLCAAMQHRRRVCCQKHCSHMHSRVPCTHAACTACFATALALSYHDWIEATSFCVLGSRCCLLLLLPCSMAAGGAAAYGRKIQLIHEPIFLPKLVTCLESGNPGICKDAAATLAALLEDNNEVAELLLGQKGGVAALVRCMERTDSRRCG